MTSRGGSTIVAEVAVPTFEPLESKLRPPQLLAGNVPRAALLDRLRDSDAVPVVLVSAAPGYGKTTLIAQWASRSSQVFAWVSVDQGDNDPIVLLSYIATALDRSSPLDPSVFEALASPNASVEATIVPRLGRALAAMETTFVLVLDDLHALTNPQCLDAIDALIDHIPTGSQLVLSGQMEPTRRVGALRARGLALEIGPLELRMGSDEAGDLLRAAEVDLSDGHVAMLVERTEGWPAGLYLAALSARAGAANKSGIAFGGDDRLIADFLRAELLSRLPEDERRFLTRTAVLDRLSGSLCDAVLQSHGSVAILESMQRSNLFVVALDPNREWYRYHGLFRESLRAELERVEPDVVPELLGRASDWCEAHAEAETAAAYAQAAGDAERLSRLVAAHGQREYQAGRAVTVEGWLKWLEEQGALEQDPFTAALGAWFSAIRGQASQAERWADAADRGQREAAAHNGAPVEAVLAVSRAAQCSRGVDAMRADAELAAESFPRGSAWWATATLMLGLSLLVGESEDVADQAFADVADASLDIGAWGAASLALAERATLAAGREDWAQAETLAERADSTVRRSRMEEYPPNALVYAVSARVAIHRRERGRADELLARANRLRPQLTRVLATLSIQARLELASAYLALADAAGARTLLREAEGLMRRGRGFGFFERQAEELRSQVEMVRTKAPGASTLTTAELRVLPLMATHLSFREVGERLYVSHNTVRSQATSIYRKLDVGSRTAAVERARELGLL